MNLHDKSFWCIEQDHIYVDVYTTLGKPIRPMSPIDVDHLGHTEYWAEAHGVLAEMGLLHLLTLQCDYNEHYILQFYSTVTFCKDVNKTLKWMTGHNYCEAPWSRFGEILGYRLGEGHHIKTATDDYDPDEVATLYGPRMTAGTTTGLLPLYAKLARLLRDNLAPRGGNIDAIRHGLIGLLLLAKKCKENTKPNRSFKVDVMAYIFDEMHDAMMSWGTVPYAPYIMMLIKDTLQNIDFSDDCEIKQKPKKPYKLTKQDGDSAPSDSGFMRDARASGAHGPPLSKKKEASKHLRTEIKKLSWYQKYVLCRSVDDHKEAYQGYRERLALSDQNNLLLHHITKKKGAAPQPTIPTPYKSWNKSKIDYLGVERTLAGFSSSLTADPSAESDTADDEDEPEDEEESEEMEESGDDSE